MKTFFNRIRMAVPLAALALSAFSLQPSAIAQGTTQVLARQYMLWNSQALTSKQFIGTNAALPGTSLGAQEVGAFTNTFIPFSGAHAIGLVATIISTNNIADASNVVVTVYPAYDTGGGSSTSLNARYGTNFSSTALLTWSISFTTNTVASTNLPASVWEPATSLGFTVSNGITSNTVFSLLMTVAP